MTRTVIDVARRDGMMAGLVAADAALRVTTSITALKDCLDECARWPGIANARKAVALADARSESPLETLSRLRLAGTGLPTADLQTVIRSLDGRFVARVDFYWDELGVVGEADGRLKYADESDLYAEKRRQEALEDLGLLCVRWGWSDLAHFDVVAGRLRRAADRGVARGNESRRWLIETTSPRQCVA